MINETYNIQNRYILEELKGLQKYVGGIEEKKKIFWNLEDHITTRWLFIGACVCSFKESFAQWIHIFKTIHNSAPSNSISCKIDSLTLNLIQHCAIKNDLELIISFHGCFRFLHFKWLQQGDPLSGNTPNFLALHMAVSFFSFSCAKIC